MARSAKAMLKSLRAVPAISRPTTTTVRFVADRLGVTPEFAIKHLLRSGLTVTTLPNGCRAKFWSKGDDWIANQLFWRGWDGYEPEVAPIFWRLAERASVILDVGAHVGYYTVLAALANPRATVIALEPSPGVYERLQRNVRLNRLKNVVALPQAAGAADGRAAFYHVAGIPSSSSLSLDFMRVHAALKAVDVEVVRIDTVARLRGLTRVDLVKLDTEATEPEVLLGMGSLLREYRPNIFCEVLTRADIEALTSLLKPLNYAFYHLTDRGPERKDVITPHGHWLNYLFAPQALGE